MINPMILVCPLDLVHYITTAQVMDMIWTVINSQPKPKIVVLDCFFFARGHSILKKTIHLQNHQTIAQGLHILN